MTVTFGGRPLTAAPAPDGVTNPARTMSHMAFACWDSFLAMQMARTEAITAWTRREAILDRLRFSTPKDQEAVARRLADLDAVVTKNTGIFLRHEYAAHGNWQLMTPAQRKEEAVDELYGVSWLAAGLMPLWRHPLGESPLPPEGMGVGVAVLACPPEQIRAYKENRG